MSEPNLQGTPAEAKTLADRAYRQLRQDIVSGKLRPGDKLRVGHLHQTYLIGASPLREALSRLVPEGFVIGQGQRGFRVAPVSLDDIWEVGNTGKLLECEALRLAIAIGDEAWEADVVAAFYRLSKVESRQPGDQAAFIAEWEQRSSDFADTLISACRSRWLLRLRNILRDQHRRYRNLLLPDGTMPRGSESDHRAIMEATIARDSETACRLAGERIDAITEAMAKSERLPALLPARRGRRKPR